MNIVLITGGFDPIHSGHIAYIKAAKEYAKVFKDMLIVGVNSDDWLIRKKGKAFLPFDERYTIVSNIKGVDLAINFDDSDNSAKDAIKKVRMMYPDAHIIFANGGDRNGKNIPEMDYHDTNVTFVFGVGGEDKKNSSSWILNNWSKD